MAILIVEDEQRVRSFIERGLTEEGFAVQGCADGTDASKKLTEGGIDLVLLDWMLPGASGLELLKGWRNAGISTPVVMLTARDALDDRVAALNSGADDYVMKPFAFEELLARTKAVLRRMDVPEGKRDQPLRCADLEMEPRSFRVVRAGQSIRVTAREFSLLRYLMEHAGEVLSRTRIGNDVWKADFDPESNVVEVYIRYLRAKIDDPFPRPLIHTIRGAGYVLREEP
jgi:two-component system copper resistance phosphate regulon response regulator CusR